MRPSNRTRILEAAFRVIDREGVTGVTFDSVAAEAEMTRGGLTYHFSSRESLIEAIHQHLAEKWEERLLRITGKPIEETTAKERFSAYAQTSAQSATRAELLFMLDASSSPEMADPWAAILHRWAPQSPREEDGVAGLSQFIARLAADGLWVYESLSYEPIDKGLRQKLVKELERIFNENPSLNQKPS